MKVVFRLVWKREMARLRRIDAWRKIGQMLNEHTAVAA